MVEGLPRVVVVMRDGESQIVSVEEAAVERRLVVGLVPLMFRALFVIVGVGVLTASETIIARG